MTLQAVLEQARAQQPAVPRGAARLGSRGRGQEAGARPRCCRRSAASASTSTRSRTARRPASGCRTTARTSTRCGSTCTATSSRWRSGRNTRAPPRPKRSRARRPTSPRAGSSRRSCRTTTGWSRRSASWPARSRACARRSSSSTSPRSRRAAARSRTPTSSRRRSRSRSAHRDAQDAELAVLKSRLGLSVLIFPDFRDTFSVVDDLQTLAPLLPLSRHQGDAPSANSPDLRAAEASVQQETSRRRRRARRRAAVGVVRLLLRHQRQPVRDPRSRRPPPARLGRAGAAQRAALELGRGAEQAEAGAAARAGREERAHAGAAAAAGQHQHLPPRGGDRARPGRLAPRVARSRRPRACG